MTAPQKWADSGPSAIDVATLYTALPADIRAEHEKVTTEQRDAEADAAEVERLSKLV